ncbi:ser-Thr-rich glycosyl-phosphatidyl-inositol-anchored membrane family protein [bacterium BMS3Abin03]|nr:ser-Thr-rich glycosyl-phosphatidyl-inositol-anchored membrane family protein [bacterium BMS3Abin03]
MKILKYFFMSCFLTLIISYSALSQTAQHEQPFIFSDEFNNTQELILGFDPYGTDGLDPDLGEVFIPQVPPGEFGARFQLPTDTSITTIKDIRYGCGQPFYYEHLIDLSYSSGSTTIDVNWNWIWPTWTLRFINPFDGNILATYDSYFDSTHYIIPSLLSKIKITVQYDGPLSWPEFNLLTPNAGDTLIGTQVYTITWWNNELTPFMDIEFSADSGLNWSFIAEDLPTTQSSYNWVIPNISSNQCLLRIGEYPCAYDQISGTFVIEPWVPVELTSFTTSVAGNDAHLNWSTATELNNSGFEIQKLYLPLNPLSRGEQKGWVKIGFVPGHGTTTEQQYYSFIDESVSSGKYKYRLKQIDYDGTFEYSDIVEVEVSLPNEFRLEQNYPNPFNPSTKIKFTIPYVETGHAPSVQLKVYDILGNEVATLVNEEKPAGTYEVEFDAVDLTSAIYFYQLKAGSFIQTKKMILIK